MKQEYIIRYGASDRRKAAKHAKRFKLSDYVKSHRRAILTILAGAALLLLILFLHGVGTAERGYSAIGGEMLVPAIPLIIVAFRDGIHEFINRMK